MSTREETSDIVNPHIPQGYRVTYHELRGYDSPAKWYEAHYGLLQIGEFGRCDEAVDACIAHSTKTMAKTTDSMKLPTEDELRSRLNQDCDPYKTAASILFKIPEEQVSKEQRVLVKLVVNQVFRLRAAAMISSSFEFTDELVDELKTRGLYNSIYPLVIEKLNERHK